LKNDLFFGRERKDVMKRINYTGISPGWGLFGFGDEINVYERNCSQ